MADTPNVEMGDAPTFVAPIGEEPTGDAPTGDVPNLLVDCATIQLFGTGSEPRTVFDNPGDLWQNTPGEDVVFGVRANILVQDWYKLNTWFPVKFWMKVDWDVVISIRCLPKKSSSTEILKKVLG